MIISIALALVLNSHPTYSRNDFLGDGFVNFDANVNEVCLFERIHVNIPPNQTNYKLSNDGATYNDHNCLNDLNRIQSLVQSRDINALQMIDAWGKLPSGILTGNFFDFGSFDECFEVEINRDKSGELIHPQYCLGKVFSPSGGKQGVTRETLSHKFNHLPRMALLQPENSTNSLNIGMCIPAQCSPKLVEQILNDCFTELLPNINPTMDVSPEWCQHDKEPSKFTKLDIVTATILIAVLHLIIMSTLYDIVCTINKKKKSEVLVTFSAFTNGRKIFSYQRNKSTDVIDCLHGIRAITTAWVLLGHTYYLYTFFPSRNRATFVTWMSKYYSMIVFSSTMSVDTFFVLSGFLVTLNLLKHLEKSNGQLNVAALYFHRYIRLTPLLVIVALFHSSLMKFFGDGPIWMVVVDRTYSLCENNWWTLLLYVQNYANNNNMCVPQSWYLSVDMQLFIIAPLIAYSLHQFKLKCLVIVILIIFLSMGMSFYTFLILEDSMKTDHLQLIYYPTHIRMLTWFVGVLLAYAVFHTRYQQIYIPRILNAFGWIVSFSLFAAAIWSNYPLVQMDAKPSSIDLALYNCLSRLSWAVALSYIIFACIHHHGGPFNWFLSLKQWQPISRLSYAIYLVHFVPMTIIGGSMKVPPHFSDIFAIHQFFSYYIISMMVATLASLAFESPILALEKLMFRAKSRLTTDRPKNTLCTNIECSGRF